MAQEQAGELLEGREPLPAEGVDPGGEEAPRRPLVGIRPQALQHLSEFVGLRQAPVHGEELPEGLPTLRLQVMPASQEEPALPPGPDPAGTRPSGRTTRAGFRPRQRWRA